MRNDLIMKLSSNPDYLIFIQENPSWHHELSIYPEKIYEFLEEYKTKRRKRFSDRIEDISMMISLAKEML